MGLARFFLLAGGTAAGVLACALVARSRRSSGWRRVCHGSSCVGDARMARYDIPPYGRGVGAPPLLPGLPGHDPDDPSPRSRPRRTSRSVTRCAPATEGSEVRVCITLPDEPGPRIRNADDVCLLLKNASKAASESFLVVLLSANNEVIGVHEAHRGVLTGVDVHPREIFRPAILGGAAAIVVAHNHPSGSAQPSAEDVALTRRLREAGELLGIPVLDHLIVPARGPCYAFSEEAR